jgi:hypothetical protein
MQTARSEQGILIGKARCRVLRGALRRARKERGLLGLKKSRCNRSVGCDGEGRNKGKGEMLEALEIYWNSELTRGPPMAGLAGSWFCPSINQVQITAWMFLG